MNKSHPHHAFFRHVTQNYFPVFVLLLGLAFLRPHAALAAEPLSFNITPGTEATVTVWNRDIVTLRATVNGISPKSRAENIAKRLLAIPMDKASQKLMTENIITKDQKGILIIGDGGMLMGLSEKDIDVESGQTLNEVADETIKRIEQFLALRDEQLAPTTMAMSAFYLIASSIVFIIIVALLRKGLRRADIWVKRRAKSSTRWQFSNVNLTPYVKQVATASLRLFFWSIMLLCTYLWLTITLGLVPYTKAFAVKIKGFFFELIGDFLHAIIATIPDLVTVLIIFLLGRLASRVVQGFFRQAEHNHDETSLLSPQSARATRRLVVFLIWAFTLVVAFPYIPGSDTEAFKGVSVFVGLMVSLGSAGVVGQVLGGLMVSYTNAFREGDMVKIGNDEGVVLSIGVLSTKLRTRLNEVVTIPNALMVSATAMNYSSLNAYATTTVTIGYDTPWRQVEAMLLNSVAATQGIENTPKAFVAQRSLSDFYVEYSLTFVPSQQDQRVAVLTRLHQAIQDEFNRFGVQIMSPHFVAQPADNILVPEEKWHEKPAEKSERT